MIPKMRCICVNLDGVIEQYDVAQGARTFAVPRIPPRDRGIFKPGTPLETFVEIPVDEFEVMYWRRRDLTVRIYVMKGCKPSFIERAALFALDQMVGFL